MTYRTDQESSNEMPASKRARLDEDYCTTKRTEELTHKIHDLAVSFPELKYIINLSDLSKLVEPAVVKYKHEVEAEKSRQQNEKNSLIYKIPDEILKSCFSFVGRGNFLLVAPVSKKFHQMYKKMAKPCNPCEYHRNGDPTCQTYHSMAASNLSTAKYCLDLLASCNKYDSEEERVKIFVEAAYKGQTEILELARHFDISYFWKEDENYCQLLRRPIEKIAKLGNLNVLKFLKNNFNMHFALPIASRGAAFGGQIHILKWLKEKKILYDIKDDDQEDTLCYSALAGGQLETLQWIRKEGFKLNERLVRPRPPFELGNMATAIKSGNIELIRYCKDQGFSFEDRSFYHPDQCDCLAIKTGNMALIRYCSEIGLDFTERVLDCSSEYITVEALEFLRSKTLTLSSETIKHAAELNQFDVLKYAHENGLEWSVDTWQRCMSQKPCINMDMLHYLYEKNCPWNPYLDLKIINDAMDRPRILEFIFSKKLVQSS
ncbi:hypothetical protein CTEN210_13468 [Chaetoceros tenuissimus]|uniref:F-box domain-containing protein n=1 Tax=Chaetoceros tenuissimus TaxID=426638 RepID=A0AAD3D3S6_9STRA|nr:hypothetical protein CTEN210_13468 [Chaetoceros tenuissimus]